MEPDAGTASDFQRSTRMPLDAVVRLHFEGTVAYQNGFAANVSASGMFVKHPAPPPIGTPLVFEFNLGPQRKPVQGSGEVVWVRDRYLGPGQPAGIGIRFTQVDTQSRAHIAEALFEFLERSLAEDSYLDPEQLAGQIGAEPDEISALTGASATDPGAATAKIDLTSMPRLPLARDASQEETRSRAPVDPAPAPAPAVLSGIDLDEPRETPHERQPFAVFSPLDSADPGTAAIVREALRDEGAPAPLVAARAAATREPGRSPLVFVAIAVVALGAGGWFAWQRWGGPATPPAPPAVTAPPAVEPEPVRPAPLSAEADPDTTLAESVGVDPDTRSAAADPPMSGRAVAAAADEEPSDVEAARAGDADRPASAAAAPAAPAAPVTAPVEPLPAEVETPRADRPQARSVSGLTLREVTGGAELTIAGNGAFAPGTFSYSEIGGDNPRVLIKLRNMESPFRGAVAGASAAVRGVRTGFHLTGKGNEVHVVVDLARPAARVAALEPTGSGLLLRLSSP